MSITSSKKQGGFTLLELLIVIVIIGILALLIIPNITSAPKKARDITRKADITAIQKGLEEYFVQNSSYPDTLAGLQSGTAPILKTIPVDPKGVDPYVYTYDPDNGNTTYILNACLENDQDHGAKVITAVGPCTTKTFQLINTN